MQAFPLFPSIARNECRICGHEAVMTVILFMQDRTYLSSVNIVSRTFLSNQRLLWRQDRKPGKQSLFFYYNLHNLYSDEDINSLMTEVAPQECMWCPFCFGSDTDMSRVLSASSVLKFSWNSQCRKISDIRETPIGYFRFLAVELSKGNSL